MPLVVTISLMRSFVYYYCYSYIEYVKISSNFQMIRVFDQIDIELIFLLQLRW